MGDDTYEHALERDGRDLSKAPLKGVARKAHFRRTEINRVLSLLDNAHSVLLVGEGGVGKSAVIFEAAHAVAARKFPPQNGCRRIIEFSSTTVLAETRYLGEWQSKVTQIARAAAQKHVAIYFTDVWNLPRAGRTNTNDTNLLDALRAFVETGQLNLVAEVSPDQLQQMQRVPGFADLFQIVHIKPLDPDQTDRAIARVAEQLDIDIDAAVRTSLVSLSSRFLPARAQPGPALQLLEQVGEGHRRAGNTAPITTDQVEEVFSKHSGLPLFVVSRRATRKATEIRSWFREHIIGQHEAIEAVIETIALFKAGLHDPHRPLGTLLFVGPTGVGKTELARCLARYIFGSDDRLLRFDLSEYKDFHSFELLLGSSQDPSRRAGLVDPVRAQPFQVVLLDELEKAHPNIWDLLLPMLDEGRLMPPNGGQVDFRNTIIIATSNVGASESTRGVGFGAKSGNQARRSRIHSALEDHFRPEFLNRFQHLVVFHPLSPDQVRAIARQELKRVLDREGLASRNLLVEVADAALDLVIERGYDERYGARALKRVLQRQLVLPLAMTIMEKPIVPGQIIRVEAQGEQVRVRLVDTPSSRMTRREAEPVRMSRGRKANRSDLEADAASLREELAQLCQTIDEQRLITRRGHLLAQRAAPDFWQEADRAARSIRDLDGVNRTLDRLDSLRNHLEGLEEDLQGTLSRQGLQRLAKGIMRLENRLRSAWRQLVYMGPDGHWDAILEIRPIARQGELARDLLVRLYTDWARFRKLEQLWIREPIATDEPAIFALRGHHAAGYLLGEAGLHRVQEGKDGGAARVRVVPWTDHQAQPRFTGHEVMRGTTGSFGNRIRSQLSCASGLVLQNDNNLAANRELAAELAGAWQTAPEDSNEVVRRYDLKTPLVRDFRTNMTSGRRDILSPPRFHELLCRRLDHIASASTET